MRTDAPQWLNNQKLDMAALLAMEGEQNALLGLAENLGHVGHWWLSLPDNAITWSAEVYQIHGLDPDHYTPNVESAIAFYHPDDQIAVRDAVAAAARDAKPFEFSLRLIRADGELRHVKSRGLAIAGPQDVPAQLFGVFVDVTDERRVEEVLRQKNLELEKIAYVDALTGLANRRQFDETLQREWLRASREEAALSLIMLDIDRFKHFNDRYGHPAGDECLRKLAAAVRADLHRPGDLMARYGGEEFALILPATELKGAEKIAQDVRSAVQKLALPHADNTSCGGMVTASLGVATAYPRPDMTSGWPDLLRQADGLLYEAKRTGRNRVVSAISFGGPGPAPIPKNETARLQALAKYEQAGATARSAELDRIARLAATLTSSPIGLVSLVGRDEQYFAGNFGMGGTDRTGRDVSFCAHTILGEETFVVADATQDQRFEENALVAGDFGLRYYAGAPIVSETTGHRLGALCVIDKSARAETSAAQRALLMDLAKMAATLLEEKATASETAAGSKT